MKTSRWLSMAGVVALCMFTGRFVQAATIDLTGIGGDIFFDHFPGTTLDAQWTAVAANGGQVVVGTDYPSITRAEIYGGGGGNDIAHIGTTSSLDFSSSTNNWWAQVTFLMPVHGGTWTSTNNGTLYRILQGQQTNDPNVAGIVQGFDLRAIRYGTGLWALGWYGDDDVFRVAEILADNAGAGYSFNDTQKYTVSMHRKSDGMLDIYFDGTAGDGSASELVASKALILGANPAGMNSGDWSFSGGGYILIDQVRIDETVPEPVTVAIAVIGVAALSLASCRRRR